MAASDKELVSVHCTVNVPVEKVWGAWTDVEHIVRWNLWPGWHVPRAENDLTVGGRFFSRMEDKDTKDGFDYTGIHAEIEVLKLIRSRLDDGRTVEVVFVREDEFTTTVTQILEPKNTYSADLQKQGWQEIMDNFKAYAEALYPVPHGSC